MKCFIVPHRIRVLSGMPQRNDIPDPVDRHVGACIRRRRIMLRMSQGELAEAMGLRFQQVQRYERGTNRVSASKLHALSQVLNVPISFLRGPASWRSS
jgi:transcriptional regulator with XRE-family HTH domain